MPESDQDTHPKLLLGPCDLCQLLLVLLNLRFIPLEIADNEPLIKCRVRVKSDPSNRPDCHFSPLFPCFASELVKNAVKESHGVQAKFVVLGNKTFRRKRPQLRICNATEMTVSTYRLERGTIISVNIS